MQWKELREDLGENNTGQRPEGVTAGETETLKWLSATEGWSEEIAEEQSPSWRHVHWDRTPLGSD